MAGLLPSIDTISDGTNDLLGAFGIGSAVKNSKIYEHAKEEGVFGDNVDADGSPWTITGTDWYKVFSYQFVVVMGEEGKLEKDKGLVQKQAALTQQISSQGLLSTLMTGLQDKVKANEFYYTLPIPPQSMSTRMIPASQVTPTVGGVVEETSSNVFWMINMSGTTGIAANRDNISRSKMSSRFRDIVSTTGLLSGPLAAVNGTISKVGGIADSVIGAVDAAASGDVGGFTGGLVGAINTALLPPLPYSGSAVDREFNGFTEMQELHRFLYTYSKLKDKNPEKYSLVFRNFKTNQEWRCAVQDFNIQQSASNPMLQRYVISLKCWGLKPIGADRRASAEFDRFGPKGDLKAVSIIDPYQMAKLAQSLYHKGKSVNILLGV